MNDIIHNKKLNITISLSSFLLFCLAFATSAENHFFCIFPISSSLVVLLERIFVILSVIVWYLKTRKYRQVYGFLSLYFLWFVLFLISQFIYTFLKYGDGAIIGFLKAANRYLWIILIFPINYYFLRKENGFRIICDLISGISVLSMCFISISAFFYNKYYLDIPNIESFFILIHRNGRLRLWDLSSLEGFAALWFFYNILYFRKNRWKYIVGLIIIFVSLFYVEQTRVMQISVILCITIMYVTKEINHKYALITKIILIIFVLTGILLSNSLSDLFESFSTTGVNAGSTIVRLDEVRYTLELIRENLIMGTGIVTETVSNLQGDYLGRGHFTYTDIGIIGLFAQIGIGAIFIYVIPMVRFFYILIKTKNYKNIEPYPFLVSVFLFLVFTSVTLIVTNAKRVYAWPFCLSFFEYWDNRCRNYVGICD